MGYMLLNERMLETFLHAKKFLKPKGDNQSINQYINQSIITLPINLSNNPNKYKMNIHYTVITVSLNLNYAYKNIMKRFNNFNFL